jgi:hypothetical protein
MTPTERAHVWQQHITDWQVSGVSGSAYCKQQSLVYPLCQDSCVCHSNAARFYRSLPSYMRSC